MIHLRRFLHLLLGLVGPGLLLRLRLVFAFLPRAPLLMPEIVQAQKCSEVFISLKDCNYGTIIEMIYEGLFLIDDTGGSLNAFTDCQKNIIY